jgi:hypothetical protein
MTKAWFRTLFSVVIAATVVGCGSSSSEGDEPNPAMDPPVDQVPGSNTGGQEPEQIGVEGGGVGTVTAGATAGGLTPMTGTESMGGGGFGVGQAAKDQARGAASKAGSGSMGSQSEDE